MAWKCSECGTPNKDEDTSCANCGTSKTAEKY
ncbi:MAG: zinc-ribbon domain-containing protein [Candidatus Dormibacteraceae bacterium]